MVEMFKPRLDGCISLYSVVGGNQKVPVLGGEKTRYVNLDNAASTPALVEVRDGVNRFLEYYSSVHRGFGYKSHLSTQAYEDARTVVANFFGASLSDRVVIFGKNTTEAVNKLSYRLGIGPDQVILSTVAEHHSNMLPWRIRHSLELVETLPDGSINLDMLEAKLIEFGPRIRLVAITGASNVTGHMPPIHEIARKVHAVGAELLVDAAQLAAHRKIDMLSIDDPARIDYLTISGHKLYAPFGTGALIGPRAAFELGVPEMVGGGEVEMVMLDEIIWAGPPDRDEAGSPNVVGAVALALALQTLDRLGMAQVAEHEMELTAYALQRMAKVPGLRFLGDADPTNVTNRTGVISFTLADKPNFLVAAILGIEAGIAVRSGCFCAHPYLLNLLQVPVEQQNIVRDEIAAGNRSNIPGAVRASLGIYNSCEDIDLLIDALTSIATDQYRGRYTLDPRTGEYHCPDFHPGIQNYFSLLQ
jgi:cysteine desulfurase / selenocysteine lyase